MIILITGTSKGIGKYLAEYYLKKGHQIIGCSRSGATITHPEYTHFQVDLCDEKGVMQMWHSVRKEYRKIDILVNNAGIAAMNHFILTPTKTARKVMDVNYFGTLLMCREGAKLMRKSTCPRIVNFTTVARPLNLEGEAVYAASKSAVETLTKVIAKELGPNGITINAIGPVPIKTGLIAGVPEEKLAELLQKQAIPRFGKLEDVSNVIDFFIRPESNFITGQIIYLGGIS